MLIIAENINIMSKTIGEAIRNREKKPVQELAAELEKAGCHALDLNAGPARKDGPELMEWLVTTVQEVTKLPLSLDTTNIEAIEAGLKVYRNLGGAPIINSISVRPERMDALLPVAVDTGARAVALMLGVEGIPRDANERGVLLAEFLYRASQAGLAETNIYVDPIVLPISSQQEQLAACTEFMTMLPELAPGRPVDLRRFQREQRRDQRPSPHPEPYLHGHAHETRPEIRHCQRAGPGHHRPDERQTPRYYRHRRPRHGRRSLSMTGRFQATSATLPRRPGCCWARRSFPNRGCKYE